MESQQSSRWSRSDWSAILGTATLGLVLVVRAYQLKLYFGAGEFLTIGAIALVTFIVVKRKVRSGRSRGGRST
jgi:hypothetical protein